MVELGAVTLTKGVSGLITRDTISTACVKDLITKATFLMARNVVSVISASSLVIKDTVAMAVVGNSVIVSSDFPLSVTNWNMLSK